MYYRHPPLKTFHLLQVTNRVHISRDFHENSSGSTVFHTLSYKKTLLHCSKYFNSNEQPLKYYCVSRLPVEIRNTWLKVSLKMIKFNQKYTHTVYRHARVSRFSKPAPPARAKPPPWKTAFRGMQRGVRAF